MSDSTGPAPVPMCRELPLEVWTRILSRETNNSNLSKLWFTCRQVSHLLRIATEEAFLSKHLMSKTDINFGDFGMIRVADAGEDDEYGTKTHLGLPMEYSRLSPDRTKAIFKDTRTDEMMNEWGNGTMLKATLSRWRNKMRLYMGDAGERRIDIVPYTIAIRRSVNDTELPGLEVDYAKREISFDWRAMFNKFFAEEERARKLTEKYSKETFPNPVEMRAKIEAGELDFMHVMQAALELAGKAHDRAYRQARRERITGWYKENENFDVTDDFWDYEEKTALATLKNQRFTSGFAEFSDEEEEEDDRRGGKDHEEEDEWDDDDEEEEE